MELVVGKNYSFSFDMFKPMRVLSATIYAYMNNIQILTATSLDYIVSSNLVYNFTANIIINTFCVNGSIKHSSISIWYWDDYSPYVDNFTLI